MDYKAVKGMSDIYAPEIGKWHYLEQEARQYFGSRLYEEIRTPLVEYTDLFQRSIGETTDIVNKEMYSFLDRGERSLTLRPEMTASVMRAVIEHNLLGEREPLKVLYMGPMFRAERPQAGRKRQFHQLGVEVIGNASPIIDAEVIKDLVRYLERVGLSVTDYTVKINTVGSTCCRPVYLEKLRAFFTPHKEQLCENCHVKLEKNVLRIFDCKNESCKACASQAPHVTDAVCAACSAHFSEVKQALDLWGVSYVTEKHMVRGLDYYTGTVFEVTSSKLGAQDAIAAGGRYNNLMKELGGPQKGAVGFAIGMERLLLCLEGVLRQNPLNVLSKTVYIAYGESEYSRPAQELCVRLERAGIPVYADLDNRSLKSQLKRANRFGFRWCLIINKGEFEAGSVTLKDLLQEGNDQQLISIQCMEEMIENIQKG